MASAVPIDYFLSKRQWLQQTLPAVMSSGFGATSSRRNEPHSPFEVGDWDIEQAVDDFVGEFDNSIRNQPRIDMRLLDFVQASESTASLNFVFVLLSVGVLLGCKLSVEPNAEWRSSPRSNMDASENAVMLASSSMRRADHALRVGGRLVVVVEMKKPVVFRRSANAPPPNLCLAVHAAFGLSPPTESVVSVEPIFQLYRYMKSMKLGYGIISSFDLTFLVKRGGDNGKTLLISQGIENSSPTFLGALAYMVDTTMKDPKDWKIPYMKHAPGGSSKASGPGSSHNQGSQGEREGRGGKKRGPHQGVHNMRTRSQGLPVWRETRAEHLHLARDHFAEGWSGRIVRGTYEGQRIVVKLAPTGSDRAEALLREVEAYHKLREFWGKYVPRLVSYGTTAGGKVVFIGTEEIDGHEIGMGTLSREVVKKAFDAFVAVHGSGILHGDIRPSNILVVKGELAGVRLIDFGFACMTTSSEGCTRERTRLECLLNEFTCGDAGVIHQCEFGGIEAV